MYEKVIFWPKTIIGEVENRFRPHYKFISSYSTNQIDIFVPICQYILTENMNEGNSVAVKLVWLYYIVTKHLTISRNQIFLYSCAFSFQKSYSKLLQPNIVYTTFQFRGIKISYKGHDILYKRWSKNIKINPKLLLENTKQHKNAFSVKNTKKRKKEKRYERKRQRML